jgi:hypothetical protein
VNSIVLQFLVFICVLAPAVQAADFAHIGAQAELSMLAHDVSGTATIVSSNSIRVDNFNYNGGGITVYFYLGTNDTREAFIAGVPIGPNLLGTTYANETVTVSLPTGQSLDGYHAISVWCVDARANFGSGAFQPFAKSLDRSNGVTSLSFSGAVGQPYQLQASTNAVDWTNLELKVNTTGTVKFTDTNALPTRLYRVEVK